MKLQSASQKEITRIGLGTLVCDGIMIAGLFLLDQFGIGKFDLLRILLGAACGSVIAVLNFAILCYTVQSAVGMENQRKMKAKFQLSYNARMILQAGWAVIAFLVPAFHFIAGAAPVLFPKFTILYLNFTGKLMPASPAGENPSPDPVCEDDSE